MNVLRETILEWNDFVEKLKHYSNPETRSDIKTGIKIYKKFQEHLITDEWFEWDGRHVNNVYAQTKMTDDDIIDWYMEAINDSEKNKVKKGNK